MGILDVVERRLAMMVARGNVSLIRDATPLQQLQLEILDGEDRDNVERIQQFGLSGAPPIGSRVLALSLGGSRDHIVVVAADDPASRPRNLESGETILYNAHGVTLYLKADGSLEITAPDRVVVSAGAEFTLSAAQRAEIASDVVAAVKADLVELGDGPTFRRLFDERFLAIFLAHTHDSVNAVDQTVLLDDVTTTHAKGS